MESTDLNAKLPFDIDLNETPLSSPRDNNAPVFAASRSEVKKSGNDGNYKGKQVLFDINALPSETEPLDFGGLVDSRMSTATDARMNDGLSACSTLSRAENGYDLMKASENAVTVAFSGPVNFSHRKEVDPYSAIMGRCQSEDYYAHAVPLKRISEQLLQGLRKFISDYHGILEDGWQVKFSFCEKRRKSIAIYCSPDGKEFESLFDVAHHLGVVSNGHFAEPHGTNERSGETQNGLPFSRKRKRSIFSRTMDFTGFQDNLIANFAGDFLLSTKSTDEEASKWRNNLRVTGNSTKEIEFDFSDCKDGFPVQYEDFFVLAIGKVDPRPTYHNSSQIWPIGFKSCWHDKITGSLFVCDVSDGGDSGPVFKVQRSPCSLMPIPIGSTLLSRSKVGVDNDKANVTCAISNDEDVDIQMIFSDYSPPFLDFDTLSGDGTTLDNVATVQPMFPFQTNISGNTLSLQKSEVDSQNLGDAIGEFKVEGRSSSSVWSTVSESMLRAFSEVFKQTGVCNFNCRHNKPCESWPCQHYEDGQMGERVDPLTKFSYKSGPVNITPSILSDEELIASSEALAKWLDQDRFGLDIGFVQELIEHLPEANACLEYKFLKNRSDKCKSLTVESGLLQASKNWAIPGNKETDPIFNGSKVCFKQVKVSCPPGKPLSSKLCTELIGDVFQLWELLWRFSEALELEEPLKFKEFEEELLDSFAVTHLKSLSTSDGKGQNLLTMEETDYLRKRAELGMTGDDHRIGGGHSLTKAHCSLLKVLLADLQSKLAAFIDPTVESGETKPRKRRRKDADNLVSAKKTMLDFLPINDLTWPELARRYILTVSSMGGNLESLDILNRETSKVFHCLQGDTGAVFGSQAGVSGMEADALLLAEATKRIFGLSSHANGDLSVDINDIDASGSCRPVKVNNDKLPEWAQVLEPVRKLPTNVGARIRKCIYEALEMNPPEWARKILEHSISKSVYKGNASGPTKKAVLSLLADVCGENQQPKVSNRKKKTKGIATVSDIVMKQCQKVLRCAVAADKEKVFCNLVGRKLLNNSDNDEKVLGLPTMVCRPLDFRTIDLRLAFGAYGGSHEAFLDDVREVWYHIHVAYSDQSDLVDLAATLSKTFEELYEKEVLTLVQKLEKYSAMDPSSPEAKKEMEDALEHASDIPRAPWDDSVCKVCSVDKDDTNVLLCDRCDSGYHTYCLDPPLPKIPEGNWYCPSCATSEDMSPSVSDIPLVSKCRRKRYNGEFVHGIMETLTNLSSIMEVKDYWDCNIEERIYLLKFLCDEYLNSAALHEHLEQCASVSAELNQKLRLLSMELRNLKFREDILAETVAPETNSLLAAAGKSETETETILHCVKEIKQPPQSSMTNQEGAMEEERTNDLDRQPQWFNIQSVSEKHSISSRSQTVQLFGSECRLNPKSGRDNSHMLENSRLDMHPSNLTNETTGKKKSLSNPQEKGCDGDDSPLANLNKEVELKKAGSSVCEVPGDSFHSRATENNVDDHLQGMHTASEVSGHHGFVKSKISALQDLVASLQSQLLKVSLRKEFLGRDSAGRIYWVFCRPDSSPWVVIDATLRLHQQTAGDGSMDQLLNTSSPFPVGADNPVNFSGSTVPYPYASGKTISESPQWYSYETDAEIQELVTWLRDNEPNGGELSEALLQRLQIVCKDSISTEISNPNTSQHNSEPIDVEKSAFANGCVTKAFMAMEKRYGPCVDFDLGNGLMKQNWDTDSETISKESMWRCKCLELVWPSRHHCHFCHLSFSTRCELNEHNEGKCSSVVHALANGKVNDNLLKSKRTVTTEDKGHVEERSLISAGGVEYERHNVLPGFPKEVSSPFNIRDISAKFVIHSSNKVLVREIGLIGSNGTPLLLPSTSPYLNDPGLKLDPFDEQNDMCASQSGELVHAKLITGKRHTDDTTKLNAIGTKNNVSKREITAESWDEYESFRNVNLPLIRDSSRRPITSRGNHIFRQLKINLLDMDAALPEEALKPSKASAEKRYIWRAFVRNAHSVFEMVQATIVFENMIKSEFLRNEWWYWSSLSAAARIATISALALRIYTLDAAILYERLIPVNSAEDIQSENVTSSNVARSANPKPKGKSATRSSRDDQTDTGKPVTRSSRADPTDTGKPVKRSLRSDPSETPKAQAKSNKRRKES